MITFNCTNENCPNAEIEYNFLGNPQSAECGGCKTILIGTDERPDPELPELDLSAGLPAIPNE